MTSLPPLMAAQTSLDRLETALKRLTQKQGFVRVDRNTPVTSSALTALLLTDDPLRNPEVLDACVILPEALKPLGEKIQRQVADAEASPSLLQQYGIARAPAVVFLREGAFLGVLQGIRNWNEYVEEVERLLNGPTQAKPIGIPVRAAPTPGACS